MNTPKFDEFDRDKVIRWAERHYDVNLYPVSHYRKFLKDSSGRLYWIFGGYDTWHGFSAKMLAQSKSNCDDGVLIVAKRYAEHIDVYMGALRPLIDGEALLTHTEAGHLQFNVVVKGETLLIHEVSGFSLCKQGTSIAAPRRSPANGEDIEALISGLNPGERAELLKALQSVGGS